MKTKDQATSRPWQSSEGGSKPYHSQLFFIGASKEHYVGEVLTINAPTILKAVNNHDKLVDACTIALKKLREFYNDNESEEIRVLKQVLTKAKRT